ncbi:MAG TPA: hypothetical protein VEX60_12675 [Pyrinomonadaceae bacterium]|nr:hypothetical protein [Pyrinomonadaceae bacterium]
MRFRTIRTCALACACWLSVGAAGVGAGAATQDNKQSDAKVSSGEREAAEKINKAKGGEAKLQAAAEFIKKYPKSSLRPRVAEAVAAEISGTQDANLKISLAQTYLDFFNEPAEADLVNGMLLTALLNASRAADVFKLAPAWLEKHPEDVDTLSRLAVLASNEVIKDNNSYAEQGQQYGAKAIELLEADKRPATADAAQWATFKTLTLPTLYRATGIISLKTGDKPTARTRLEKAAALRVADPAVYLILVDLINDDYDLLAKQYKAALPGAEKDALLKRVNESLDTVMEAQARALANLEGNAQYQPAYNQLKKDLEQSYKFRHGGSTDGLQKLMDKYKQPATP